MKTPDNIALYYSSGSCALAPHIVLNEIGVAFELREFSTAKGENFSAEYLAVNPKGYIPALLIDELLLTENPAILAFLGRTFSEANLYPTQSAAEARCLEWLAWCSNTAHVAFAQIFRPERYVLSEKDYPAVIESGHKNYQDCLRMIDAHLKDNAYALGDQFSVVDPFWLVFYRWATMVDYKMSDEYPYFSEFAARLLKRPAVTKALMVENISIPLA